MELESEGNLHNIWIMPAAFSPLSVMNRLSFLKGDTILRSLQETNIRTANAKFVHKCIPEPLYGWKRASIMVAIKMQNRGPGGELFVDQALF